MYYKFFSEDFIRTEVNVRLVKIMKAYGCLVFCSVLSKFVFDSRCICSRHYTLILEGLNKLNQI